MQIGIHLIASLAIQLHCKKPVERTIKVSPAVEGANPSQHGKSPALLDEIPDFLQIGGIEVGAVGEVVKDD